MNEELQSLIDRAIAAGRSPGQIISALKQNGLDDGGIMSADSYIKKKSPSDLGESSSPLDLRPSVSESLGSERVQIGFDDAAIQQKKKAISDAAAAQVYTAVAKTGGDLNKIQNKQDFADAYTTYRSMSDDPRASLLPQNPVAQNGQIDFAVVPTLKKGAVEYINDLIKQEDERKATLGDKFTVPILSEAAAGAELAIGGLLKFNEMITGKDSELSDFFLDDAEVRGRDAKIDYGNSEEEISKGFINNLLEGNIKAAFVNFGVDLVQQVPQLALVATTGGAGLPLLAASAAGGGYASLEDRSDLSEGEKMLYGIGVGAAEYLAERLFLGDINAIRKALGKEGIESLTKKELGDIMFGALPKGVRSVMEEGTEELLTSVAQQTLGKIIAGEEFNPIEIAESAIYGGTMGGGVYLLSRGSGAIVDPENEAEMRGLKNILKRTKKAEEQPDITEAEKEALGRKVKETQEALNALKLKDDELVARMSEEDRVVLKDIQTQIKSNMRDIRSAKTDEGAEQLSNELRKNLDKLEELKDKYDRQKEAGIPSPIVEGEAPIEAQPIEGASQETPEAGGVLQVPIEEGVEVVDKPKEEIKPQEVTVEGDDLILRHGSPYEFDKFLLEKVGTGEGNQAFGYGLYFTESSGIAKSYAKKLSEDKTGLLYTIRVKGGNTGNWLPWREPITDGYLDKLQLTPEEQAQYQEYLNKERDDYPIHFEAYGDFANDSEYFFAGSVEAENVPNSAVYNDLADALGKEKATEILKRSGYSGIVYNSKKGYGDAKNYVVFDPEAIEIVEVSGAKKQPETEEVGPAVEDITFGTAFDLQDKTAERTVSDKNAWGGSGLIRERIENAGDILRELSSRGDQPDPGYIQEKIDKLRSWIPDNASVKSNAIPSDIKTIDDFNKTNLRWSNVTDGFEYLMKFNSDVVNKIRSEYEAIPTYTKEQKLAKDSVLALLNQDITGLEKNLDSLQDVVNTIEREGKLEIVKSVEPPIVESLPQEVTSAPQQLTEAEEIISPLPEQPVTEVVTPIAEPTAEVEATTAVSEEESELIGDIELNEGKIEDLKAEIQSEKGNIKEELERLRGEIVNVRSQKLPADEKRELIEDLKAQMEDARNEHDGIVQSYKDEIRELNTEIKGYQKKINKIREKKATAAPVATPVAEPAKEAPSAVSTNSSGDAFISQQNFRTSYPNLFSFLNTGEIYRRERGASDTRNKYLKENKDTTDQVLRLQNLKIFDAKNILVMMSSYTPRTKADIDRFNQAYLETEQLLADMQKAQKNDTIYKTKAQVITAINRQRSLSQKQKDVLTSVINTVKADKVFNINFMGNRDFYAFATNLLKANHGSTFIHEIGHWGYFNLLSPQERIDYMNYMSEKFLNRELTGLVYPAAIDISITGGTNAKDSYQEYFANQFDQWFTNKVGAEGVLLDIYNTLKSIVDNLINLFKEKGYNPDLVRYFDKIADTTKYGMDKAQIEKIDSQLNEDLNVGDNSVGNPGRLSESIYDQEDESELDIRQETMKDRAKKSWRSMWWSDEQKKIRTFKESLSSMLSREGMKIQEFAVGLNRILKNADQSTIDLVSKVMDGSIEPDQKVELTQKKDGELIFGLSNAMREYIDSLSEDIIFDPAFSKLSDDLQDTIIKNLGTYLRGTYRFWKDKRFFPGEETIKAAIEEVYNTMYNEKFLELEQLFDVDGLESNIAKLEDQYEQLREDIIEEERKLPAGEKTVEIKAMIANLEALGKELNEARKLVVEQKKVMKELLKTDEMTPENIRAFKALKNSYIDSQLEFLAPAIKSEAKDFVKAYLEEAKKIRERDDFKGLGMISPSSIKIPNKQFSQRKNLPETIKALLGEEKDPIIRFVDSALSLSNIKYKGDMIYKIASQFNGTDFVKNNATRAEMASGEYRIVTDKFSPLNGKYVHKDVFEAITDPQLYSAETAWFQTYLNILLLARKSKVIYNLPTWRKNLTGGWYTMMANGVINPSFFSDMRRRTELLFDKRTDPETEALLDLMAQYGLLGQGVDANLIGAVNVMYTRPSTGSDMEYLSTLEKLVEKGKGIDSWLGGKYASVDDYTKLVVFRSEIESFAVKLFDKKYSDLSNSQKETAHEQAAERVKQSTPTFSRLPPFYYKLAQMPLGDFLSFEFEAFRSFTANFANGYEDIQKAIQDKTLSTTQKAAYMKAGVARLMGTAAVFGARAAVPAILAGLALGDDDDLEEDLKALRPNWMEGHSIVPTNITKDGMATVYDYSMEDPYGTIFDVATDPLSFPSHMISMLNPNMAITFLFNLQDSKDVYGKDIVNSYDSPFTKAYKYGGYTLKSLIVPPFASSALRDELRTYELEAEKYSPLDMVGRVASRAVIRDYKYDVASQLYYFGREFATKKEQYSDLSGIARGNRLAQLDEVRNMYKGLINIAIKKGNTKLIFDANKNIKRQFKPFEEAYILYGYEIPEQQ
jgi:hypothetical protein